MTPLTEDDIVERVYRAHGNSPTPQLRPVLRRIWAAGLSIVEADALNAADPGPDPKFCPICMAAFHADGTVTPHAADPGPDTAPERT